MGSIAKTYQRIAWLYWGASRYFRGKEWDESLTCREAWTFLKGIAWHKGETILSTYAGCKDTGHRIRQFWVDGYGEGSGSAGRGIPVPWSLETRLSSGSRMFAQFGWNGNRRKVWVIFFLSIENTTRQLLQLLVSGGHLSFSSFLVLILFNLRHLKS